MKDTPNDFGAHHRARQLRLRRRLEHDARRAVEGSRDDQLALGFPFNRRAVIHGGRFTLASCVHPPSPSVSIPGQPRPTRRSVRQSQPAVPLAYPCRFFLQSAPGRACRSARRRLSSVVTSPACSRNANVLLHAREGHVAIFRQDVRDRSVRTSELLQDAASGGVGERSERGIEVFAVSTEPYGSVFNTRVGGMQGEASALPASGRRRARPSQSRIGAANFIR